MKEKIESVLYDGLLIMKVCCEEFRLIGLRTLVVVCLRRIEFRRGIRELEKLSRERNKFFDEDDWRRE